LGPSSTFWTIPKGFPLGRKFHALTREADDYRKKFLARQLLSRQKLHDAQGLLMPA